jgi:hypothetical protein
LKKIKKRLDNPDQPDIITQLKRREIKMNNQATITAKLLHTRRYASSVSFPKIFWGDVSTQCRNFDSVGQKMVVVAHNKATIWSALFNRGIGATITAMDIPYHFEVTATKKNMTPKEAKLLRSLKRKVSYRLKKA